jgi:hypothetical protein
MRRKPESLAQGGSLHPCLESDSCGAPEFRPPQRRTHEPAAGTNLAPSSPRNSVETPPVGLYSLARPNRQNPFGNIKSAFRRGRTLFFGRVSTPESWQSSRPPNIEFRAATTRCSLAARSGSGNQMRWKGCVTGRTELISAAPGDSSNPSTEPRGLALPLPTDLAERSSRQRATETE